jgi:hypothetical protein
VSSQTELEQVLAHEGSDLSSQMIEFVSQRWHEADDAERLVIQNFLASALEQVVAAGLLPAPSEELPAFGTRVEVMVMGAKPGPATSGTPLGCDWWAHLSRPALPFALDHTSGHASVEDLQRLVEVLKPGVVVPIHTEGAGRFGRIFKSVVPHRDGSWWAVRGWS